ncbi:MAG: DUF3137 domain-containing protein [Bacteroidetes bacterium]|nr:DUF3137 domain-containing protein [Bacteroidota bacterium]
MKRLEEFRIYYNHTIHPELIRLERRRKQLLVLLSASAILLLGVFIFELLLNVLVITLFLMIPISLYITYLLYRIRRFRITFKPQIVNLVLDFIDDSLNFGTLHYDPKKFIPKQKFLSSRIFVTAAPLYLGEDYIGGKIGEIEFELCELNVREYSPVRTRLNYVFKGVFLHATFHLPLKGIILMWPKEFRQYLTRSIKAFTLEGAREVTDQLSNSEFRNSFLTYAKGENIVQGILSDDMQHAIVNYREQSQKKIYLSFIDKEVFIGVTEPKNILEPYLFRSNVSFELVREFFEDIQLLISVIEDIDRNH